MAALNDPKNNDSTLIVMDKEPKPMQVEDQEDYFFAQIDPKQPRTKLELELLEKYTELKREFTEFKVKEKEARTETRIREDNLIRRIEQLDYDLRVKEFQLEFKKRREDREAKLQDQVWRLEQRNHSLDLLLNFRTAEVDFYRKKCHFEDDSK